MASRGLRKTYFFPHLKACERRNFDFCVFLEKSSVTGGRVGPGPMRKLAGEGPAACCVYGYLQIIKDITDILTHSRGRGNRNRNCRVLLLLTLAGLVLKLVNFSLNMG